MPEQPDEIVRQALECRKAGAAIVHVHARDEKGKNTMDLNIFRKVHDGIRNSSDLIVELSTGGGPTLPMAERIGPLSLKPEMASLNTFMIMLNTDGKEQPIIYSRAEIEATARRARDMGVRPNVAVLNFSCLEEAENLIEKGLLDPPYCLSVGLGMPAQGALKATPRTLFALIDRMPQGAIFSVSAHGLAQVSLTTLGMLLGGHVRVGLEDSVYYTPERLAKSNAELVARTVRLINELDFEVATPAEAREVLHLGK